MAPYGLFIMDYNVIVSRVLQELGSKGINNIIGFSGGSEIESEAETRVKEAMGELSEKKVAILTGGTRFGVPKFAVEQARKVGLSTIGVYPNRGAKYALPELDYSIEVSSRYGKSEWGDESEIFAKIAHGILLIGGGMGTMIEFAHIMKINEARVKEGLSCVYVSPIVSSNSKSKELADLVGILPMKKEVRDKSIPGQIYNNGKDAARFLIERLKIM